MKSAQARRGDGVFDVGDPTDFNAHRHALIMGLFSARANPATQEIPPPSLASSASVFYNFQLELKGAKLMKVRAADLAPRLEQVEDQFVELWNNMATLWGISPTMARIHGLLYITGAALSMDDIMARLAISRGNVSMNLSQARRVGPGPPRPQDAATARSITSRCSDVWEMFTLVANQRKRREIDPILNTLRRCQES